MKVTICFANLTISSTQFSWIEAREAAERLRLKVEPSAPSVIKPEPVSYEWEKLYNNLGAVRD